MIIDPGKDGERVPVLVLTDLGYEKKQGKRDNAERVVPYFEAPPYLRKIKNPSVLY